MAENVQKKDSSKTVTILLIVLILLVIGGIAAGAILLSNRNVDEDSSLAQGEETTAFTIGYEMNGVVALGEEALQDAFNEMARKAEEGMMDVQYQNVIHSKDGVNFTCSLGNSETNRYDMYLNIYLDYDLDQQMLLTGLIPPESKIDSFKSEIPLKPGRYEAMLVFTQIEDDHATIHGQSKVALIVIVGDSTDINENAFTFSE